MKALRRRGMDAAGRISLVKMLHQRMRGVWQAWRRLPAGDRVRFTLLALLVPVASFAAYAAFEATPDMAVLAESLDADTSQAVTRYLDYRGVPYVTVDEGQTILVPASFRAEVTFESIERRAQRLARNRTLEGNAPPRAGGAS